MSATIQTTPSALVVAHPGHELRLFGWLCQARPQVLVLTDGSGRRGRSRLDFTTRVLDQTGATPGGVYGQFSDQQIYSAILEQDFDFFLRLVDLLSEVFVNSGCSFGVRAMQNSIDSAQIAAEIRRYDPEDAARVSHQIRVTS